MRLLTNVRVGGARLVGRAFTCAVLLLLASAAGRSADTIVLKNGRRIVALTVTQDGDKVRYQTTAGELSLPKSMVDHIETGSAPAPDALTAAAAANLRITPPTIEASAAIEKGAVHDDSIDREYWLRWRARRDQANVVQAESRHWRCILRRNSNCREATLNMP